MSPAGPRACPLCGEQAPWFHTDRRRDYHRCRTCRLVFVPPQWFPSPERERAEYELHENSPADAGYRRFLSRLADPLLERIQPYSRGLDVGCGPGPALPVMLEERGHSMEVYDPFFAPDESVFDRKYDFVTATEVFEHLHTPAATLERVWRCVRPGGHLGVMTKLVRDRDAFSTREQLGSRELFAQWHYKDDDTHVCFFSRDTFRWLAARWSTAPEFIGNDVIVFEKPPG